MTCADEEAVKWLSSTVEEIGKEKELKLEVIQEKEIPVLTTVKLPILTSDAKEALQLVKAQNPTLKTERWQVHQVVDLTETAESNKPEKPSGNDLLAAKWLLVCSVDQQQVEALRAKNNLVYVGMKRFRARVNEANKREDGAGDTNQPAPQ